MPSSSSGSISSNITRPTVLAVVVRLTEVDPSELLGRSRRPHASSIPFSQIARDDPQLHRFVEDGLSHCSPALSR